MLLAHLRVRSVARPTPSFARIELGGPQLADFGVEGPLFDQRFKLLLPGPGGLPQLSEESWWSDYSALPEETRGAVRTYTIADVLGEGADTRILVDFVLHSGAHGPGSDWAEHAAVGDEVLAALPRRGSAGGGIEFDPGDAERLLLVGDETALPAIHQILRQLPEREGGRTGAVFVEVPCAEDICDLPAIDGVEVTWLPRGDRSVGEPVIEAVSAHLGFAPTPLPAAEPAGASEPAGAALGALDDMPWETPTYSALGEEVIDAPAVDGRYAWIAGESGMVTTLRRHLVGELGMPRHQVAFMGYWREGVAMRA
ncbi:siderophore-interacting protein [Nocardioides sp. BP30]|uniref:siderophore-interacting protein n=1 Tax=Nocardioides sp. BP30 TaxID=3036374 RepID=UPI0024693080|nr:siderophore-interacting protein [Nocardioides sp. BP30]WGL52310.1 siderophore-interacting protein [Nocardioides sp. BP30]